jgi:hypothetical protein
LAANLTGGWIKNHVTTRASRTAWRGSIVQVGALSVFEERKSGLTRRLNFSGSAWASSRLKLSSLSRVFSLIDFCGFDFFRGTPKA